MADRPRMMSGWDWAAFALVIAVVLGGGYLLLFARSGDREGPIASDLTVAEVMAGSDTAGFARAAESRAFRFPVDHGAHPDFRTEWWYLTGNLESESGDRFGFQFTLFRSALAPGVPELASEWATNQAWMGHFTVTDVEGERFRAFERFARGAGGLAGATAEPFRVWLEDWTLASTETGAGAPATAESPTPFGTGIFPLALRATGDDSTSLTLTLEPGEGLILQGDEGLSQKGPEPGNASYYYTFPRMPASGTVRTPRGSFRVTGEAWMDREWSTSALSEDQVGWDWFALQLGDGAEIMVYGLRRRDGSPHPLSSGVVVGPDGRRTKLRRDDFELEVTDRWESPVDGAVYPSGWRLRIPGVRYDLTVEPVLPDQELNVTFRYWEGAVDVSGDGPAGATEGRGYVELTGYAGEGPPGS